MYSVRAISQNQFSRMQVEWDALLERSDADPLFMSWSWQASWWEVWGSELGLQLLLLGVYDQESQLVALAPLYFNSFATPVGWRVKRLHVVGNAWKLGPTVRTEYIGFITDVRHKAPALEALASYLKREAWDELILADTSRQAMDEWEPELKKHVDVSRLVRSEAEGVAIDTSVEYSGWLAELGKNTRLKAFNRRAVFEGDLQGEWRAWTDAESFLELLNEFHQERWGKACFDGHAVHFHRLLLSRLSGNQQARLSVLNSRGKVLSVLYDIRAGSRVYNLQAGFAEEFHPKISLGTLHLGYAIEQAFSDPAVLEYDLLAGAGKNTFYKSHFKGRMVPFTTVEYVRSPLLKMAYGARGYLPQRLVTSVNRFFRL
ncbi:MAG TPA: GNAT family N-acetyltransferase [Marinobacter sp.]|nr:GNAT family N-acetyltransferase [Marinobacter sp.]